MPRSRSSAESKKGLPNKRHSLESQGATTTPPPDHPFDSDLTDHGNRPSSSSRGHVSALMPDRSIPREGQQSQEDPSLSAVATGPPAETGAAARVVPHGGPPAGPIDKPAGNAGAKKLEESTLRKESAVQLNQYREQLAKDMQRNVLGARPGHSSSQLPKRVSPIQEESYVNSPSQVPSGPCTVSTNASTESGRTIRGAITPGFMPKTPSYPFPRIGTPGYAPSSLHKPFTTLSPTGSAPDSPASSAAATATANFGNSRVQDSIMSNPSSPASAMAFRPELRSQSSHQGDFPDFPTPNLYELSLRLSSEPGLEAWWRTVVQIMSEEYQAERLTLAIPADVTDLENVPWGQKATYNARQEDGLSLEYLARGSSFMSSSRDATSRASLAGGEDAANLQVPARPGMTLRHSYAEFEAEKQKDATMGPAASQKRPGLVPRSQTLYAESSHVERPRENTLHVGLNKQALEEHDAEEEQEPHEEWEAPGPGKQNQGRLFETLQALDYEADPLIDHHGVTKVLERGRVIALTRSYPYTEGPVPVKVPDVKDQSRSHSPEGHKQRGKRLRHDSSTKLSNILSSAHSMNLRPHDRRPGQQNIDQMISEGEPRRPPTPSYEEFEQAPPSPWSQSPAPSPAIRAEAKDNPFFSDAMVDESSFDPTLGTPDYTAIGPQEAIGVDNAWTVLHIPFKHPVLSKASNTFKLDPKLMEQKSHRRGKDPAEDNDKEYDRHSDHESLRRDKQTPIAILSILSSTIPYPSNLRYSLEHLAPHLATSFSLCRHYSTLEAEVTRMHHRRPRVAGFGAVDPDGRPITDPAVLDYISEEGADQSLAGSLTSPSEYSMQSRSAAGTPGGTPGWEMMGFGHVADKRPGVPSPAPASGDSYFTTRSKTAGKADVSSVVQQRARRGSKGSTSSEKRSSFRADSGRLSPDVIEPEAGEDAPGQTGEDTHSIIAPKRLLGKDMSAIAKEERAAEARALNKTTQTPQRHKKLHSYGGDFATTFQSLPPGSRLPSARGTPPRSDSTSLNAPEMAWPTDRLRELILDSLPAQLFVASLPGGGIVWVNSRYIAYRGQTLAELYADPYASIHPDDRETYLSVWGRAVKTGEDFQMSVRIRRFDGAYRCFSARVVACRNRRNEIVYYLGSYTDIHEQTVAELKVVRQQEIEASEAKHRLLANLIPEIIFTATEDEGITFSNEQWLSYTGQSEEDALGLGFMGFVHPDDLAKCQMPSATTASTPTARMPQEQGSKRDAEVTEAGGASVQTPQKALGSSLSSTGRNAPNTQARKSSGSELGYGPPHANLTELAKSGVVKVGRDSSGRLTYATEIRLRSKTGEYRWHLVRCVEIDNVSPGSGASSYFGSATDINDHKLLEAKLKEAMESKSRFLSNMSHEIRTPLIGISGMVSFLQDTTLNEEQRDYTNTIQTSANSLLMIINDILDLSKVDAGMMKLNHEWFHTRALIEDVNELVSAMAIARRLELNYLVDEDVPTYIKGDKVRIRQVLLNVIGNAVKFTETGEVFSRCKVKTGTSGLGQNEVMLEFAVIDTGRGFTEEERKLIFKPFSQIDGSSTRAHGGSGLGLVISRQLVELHGGVMEGTAVPGKGATFTFTAKFSLPTEEDHPDAPSNPAPVATPAVLEDIPTQPFKQFIITKQRSSISVVSPVSASQDSPAVASSGSSVPSVTSTGTRATERSSISSVTGGLARFSEAARASGQDLTQMKLEMPSGRTSPRTTPTATGRQNEENDRAEAGPSEFRPPMFSILVICPPTYSRKATTRHIEMTLPKEVPHQITALSSAQEAEALIGQEDPVIFTHIIINLASVEEVLQLMYQIHKSASFANTLIVLLTDSIQRQDLAKLLADKAQEHLMSDDRLTFVYKPVKPSRLAVIFDPAKEGDASVDRNRSTAQRLVENQKKSYLEVEKRMGNKGYKVLLVEDNPVNQKVLNKYLAKVGLEVDIAIDGQECTEKVFSQPTDFYSLILCDLHMPRKDGYQACREIRDWEHQNHFKPMPIIALSANVMSDVQDKCVEAGFSDYVTKPVDFINLSTALSKFF